MRLPQFADTIVVGGGTTGAVVAGLLAEHSDERVLVLEAGPDYGPADGGGWPPDLLDAAALGYTADWGYTSEQTYQDRVIAFERARVIGGCSAHNGCAAIWGSRVDYDGWAARGLAGWATDDLLPLFREANRRMRVRTYEPAEITPFQAACLEAAAAAGVPVAADLNDLGQDVGMAASPVNIADGVRWNTAFAYLDPVRHRPNLTIIGGAAVSHLLLKANRVRGAAVLTPNGIETVAAGRVVVSGGAYGSPVVLQRSGIGDPEELRTAGAEPRHALPGVGKNLHDHPSVSVMFGGTVALERRMVEFAAERWMPEEQTIAKLRSPLYPDGAAGFDLHLYPVGGPAPDGDGWRWRFPVACMTPRSRGSVELRSADPNDAPRIDHAYQSDPDGFDTSVLAAGLELARTIASQPPLRDLLGEELGPGPAVNDRNAAAAWVRRTGQHYYHPVGTCAMGPAGDPMAVCDARGKVHGLDNLFVADCSIVPVIPRANTNIPAVVVGERVGRGLLGQDGT